MRYTPTHAVQREPMKSTREAKSFRLVSDGFVPRSRTITRTISAEQAVDPFSQLSILMKVLVATLRSMCAAKENLSLIMFTSTSVNPCPLGQDASPVRPELVLGFLSTPLHTTVRCCPVCPVAFPHHQNQCGHHGDFARVLAHFYKPHSVFPSDCLPDVPQQLSHSVTVAGDCPRSVRVSRGFVHAS